MATISTSMRRLRLFFERDLWRIDAAPLSRAGRLGLALLQQGVLVMRNFTADRCLLLASALTYTSILSLVPFLALVFAVLKGLGVQNLLEPMLLQRFTVGGDEVVGAIVRYINNTNVATLGAFGMLLLVVTVYMLLSRIERCFNSICGVRRNRSPYRRFADYFSVGLIGPILLLAAISVTTTLKSQGAVQMLLDNQWIGPLVLGAVKFVPFVVMWIVFVGLYIFMPNTRVRWRAALAGGVFGGTLWQLAQYAYIGLQVGVSRHNAIYGTLAALPIFMVWIFLSWAIVLLGLEVVNVVQNFQILRQEVHVERLSFAGRTALALTVLLRVGRNFLRGRLPLTQEQLTADLGVSHRQLGEILQMLVRLHLLAEVVGAEEEIAGYQPARSPETLELAEVLRQLRADGISAAAGESLPERAAVRRLLEELETAETALLAERTLADAIRQAEPAAQED